MKQNMNAVCTSIPKDTWDKVAKDLVQNGGVATLHLPLFMASIHEESFRVARAAFDFCSNCTSSSTNESVPMIGTDSDSAHATGYHAAGSTGSAALSRYNAHREGFIFSDGALFDINIDNGDPSSSLSFEKSMKQMFHSMHNDIAVNVLKAITRRLDVDGQDWFQSILGPTGQSSQWHVKRYLIPSQNSNMDSHDASNGESASDKGDKKGEKEETEWLPVHTDPSLISVVIHDVPGTNDGAMGLQYQSPISSIPDLAAGSSFANNDEKTPMKKKRVWKEVSAHGHAVATIFCGSVLSYITGGFFPSAKHRVVYRANYLSNNNSKEEEPCENTRIAATMFVRPRGDAILSVPPCTVLEERNVKIRRELKFRDWLSKVSRHYSKQRNDQNKNMKKINRNNNKKDDSKDKWNGKEGDNGNLSHHLINKSTNFTQMDPAYWVDEYTELTLHSSEPPLYGREKFLGGELCETNGHIYTIPGFANRVLDMDVTTDPPILNQIGPELKGEFKWLRGIPIGNIIYGIPCHSDAVLKIDTTTNHVELLQWDQNISGAPPPHQKWKYHGAAIAPYDGCIYCIPQAAERVLKIDPKTEELSFIGPAFPGVNKWYGGLLGKADGAIYGICQNASGVLRIDAKTRSCTVHGDFGLGGFKWHGAVNHCDGNMYGIPAHADRVLKIVPGKEPKLTIIGTKKLRSGEHRSDNKYKFLGGAMVGDFVYFFPSDADYVCQVNTKTDEVREVGPNLRDLEPMRNNKWQNGFTARDGTIFGIPLKGTTVLRIRQGNCTGTEPNITTIGGPYTGLNKWEGGTMAMNGDMYCMPLNYNYSLRIRQIANDCEKDIAYKNDLIPKKYAPSNSKDSINSDPLSYTTGNPTLRSSAHTLRYSGSRSEDPGPNYTCTFPHEIRKRTILSYDIRAYNFCQEIVRMLSSLDPDVVGNFQPGNMTRPLEPTECLLEMFSVPKQSLIPKQKSKFKHGKGDEAQRVLSEIVHNDEDFLALFDRFISEVVLPPFKERLVRCGLAQNNVPTKFYYQCPPTLRIQPGPSTRDVRAHSDAMYGHQDGELNFWMPLTDPTRTKTDLWAESSPGKGDFKPLGASIGEVVSFHGSSCFHHVPPNPSKFTRVSLDFRVGVKGFFDPTWRLRGTKADHSRKQREI